MGRYQVTTQTINLESLSVIQARNTTAFSILVGAQRSLFDYYNLILIFVAFYHTVYMECHTQYLKFHITPVA